MTDTLVCVDDSLLVITTPGDQDTGLQRMQRAGAVISSTKALLYEWLRSVDNTRDLQQVFDFRNNLPTGLIL